MAGAVYDVVLSGIRGIIAWITFACQLTKSYIVYRTTSRFLLNDDPMWNWCCGCCCRLRNIYTGATWFWFCSAVIWHSMTALCGKLLCTPSNERHQNGDGFGVEISLEFVWPRSHTRYTRPIHLPTHSHAITRVHCARISYVQTQTRKRKVCR